jgi:L-ascorbate metabolism protein UlaG (beta-lactamase superfamily)
MFLRRRHGASFFSLRKIFCSTARFRFGETMAKTQLTWYGHSAFKLITPSGNVVFIDPWLKNPVLKNGEEVLTKIDRADVICLTHGHFDHVGDAVEIAKNTKAKLCCTFDCAVAVRNALGFPGDDDNSSYVSHIGGTVRMFEGEMTARFVPAWHGAAVMPSNDKPPIYGGTPSGVVLSIKSGPAIYHTGDTDLFSDMSLVPLEGPIDYMLVCMGDFYTMGPMRAARAVELVKPRIVIPIHYGTFPALTGTTEAFGQELKGRGLKSELRVMNVGETITV